MGCVVVAAQQGSASVDQGSSGTDLSTGRPPEQESSLLPFPEPSADSTTGASSEAERTGGRPTRLLIPAIEVATHVVGLGLQDDGTVEVPSNPDRAGWYRHGAIPGTAGAAVLLGHVDSATGPAVFARLGTLGRGDTIEVVLKRGRSVEFRVRAVQTYLNDDFPARRVYRSRGDHHDLNLVTCAGEYRSDAGGYQSNVVVFARQVRT
ncbi:class F sortase [soil metagenome]